MATITQTNFVSYVDDVATRTAQIDFYVLTDVRGQNPLTATGTGAFPAIPAMFSIHPFDGSSNFPAIVDKRNVEAMDATGLNWKVSLMYSSDGRFRFNPSLNLTKLTAESFVRVDFKYPILTPRPVLTVTPVFNAAPGATTQYTTRFDWQKQERTRVFWHENYQVRIVLGANGVPGVYDSSAESKIRSQCGKFHYLSENPYQYTFPGDDLIAPVGVQWPLVYKELWCFNGCDVDQVGTSTWNLTYSWTRDPGNNRLAPPGYVPDGGDGDVNLLNPSNVYPLARPPFFQYQIDQVKPTVGTSGSTVIQYPPIIFIIPEYADTDITGYAGAHSLPGTPV